jgi:hypothetical protein
MKFWFCILASMLGLAVTAAAQTPNVQTTKLSLGNQVVIIPTPVGFEEAASQFEEVKRRMTVTEDPSNDMLAVHLQKEDCDKLRQGASPVANFYTKVSIRRPNRTRVFTEKDFGEVVARFRENGAQILDLKSPQMKAIVERLDKTLSELNNGVAFEMSQPINLGEFDTRPNVYSVMLTLNYSYEENGTRHAKPLLGSLSYLRVKDRLLYVYTYRLYASKNDIEVLQEFTRKWIGEIISAN